MYQIMCRVSGGVTGTRQSWMKNSSGETMHFRREVDAEAVAKAARERPGLKHSQATFEYVVVKMK
jgi:hypothetical protein